MIHPVRIAHRGASGSAPENTVAAFERAIRIGVDAIEIDVHGTSDGRVVVIHDATLDRTTDRRGLVRQQTLDQIRNADAGTWFGREFKGAQIPLLEEAIEAYTKGPAWASFEEDIKGTLTAGKLADVTGFDTNLVEVGKSDPKKLLDAKMLYTVAGGKVVYERP